MLYGMALLPYIHIRHIGPTWKNSSRHTCNRLRSNRPGLQYLVDPPLSGSLCDDHLCTWAFAKNPATGRHPFMVRPAEADQHNCHWLQLEAFLIQLVQPLKQFRCFLGSFNADLLRLHWQQCCGRCMHASPRQGELQKQKPLARDSRAALGHWKEVACLRKAPFHTRRSLDGVVGIATQRERVCSGGVNPFGAAVVLSASWLWGQQIGCASKSLSARKVRKQAHARSSIELLPCAALPLDSHFAMG
jgi:hypothetical protein